MEIKKYKIIGDLHGRTNWHQLVEPFDENTVYVFVGDYTDPYYGWEDGVNYNQMIDEINRMFDFKKLHPDNVILLIGNHDVQYWLRKGWLRKGDKSRYDWQHSGNIGKLFWDNKDLFHGIAYHVGEKYLITHAGVTYDWYTRYCDNAFKLDNVSLVEICDNINKLWWSGKTGMRKFTFSECTCKLSDYYGDSPTHSPIWIRPVSLWEHNLFGWTSGIIQVVGHTPFDTYKNNDWIGKIGTYCTEKQPDSHYAQLPFCSAR